MFGRKKPSSQINKDQLELIENAQKRIRQKKRLYSHFVLFLIGSIFAILANTVLGIGKTFTVAGVDWFVLVILVWLFFLSYHCFNVYITNRFMGKAWEKKQLEKLVAKQQKAMVKLEAKLEKDRKSLAQKTPKTTNLAKETNEGVGMNLTLIAAAGEDNSLGKDNDLIWHLSDDLKRFKSLTNGHHIIMGRKTFESFPKPLPNRTHIVISRNNNYTVPDGVKLASTIEEAIAMVQDDDQPFIIGGGQIYKQALTLVDRIELTRVHAEFPEADTFFPEIDNSIWQEQHRTTHDVDHKHKYPFSFISYTRR